MPTDSITIQTGARLHFGPLSFRPERGRHFGGIGLMIAEPGFRVIASLSDQDQIASEPSRVAELVGRIREERTHWKRSFKIELTSTIPSHHGLGSGTQLGMALAEALGELHGDTDVDGCELARLTERGKRSSIGLHGYHSGGFLIDAGHAADEIISPISCRFPFPEDWPILLVTPPASEGISGAAEASTFQKLGSMSPSRSGELCRLALTEIAPAIQTQKFELFASAIRDYGILVGEFFREHQGGVFSHPGMESLVRRLAKEDVVGIAQTSWGPTVAIFVNSIEQCETIQAIVANDEFGRSCHVVKTRALNCGRTIISSL